jgi:membrane protein YqaA with SNARE-associated domain
MENQNQPDSFLKVTFDDNAREQLKTIALWAKICALCAFISYAVALIVAVFAKTKSVTFGGENLTLTSYARAGAIAGAIISAVIGCAINYFLYRFATDAKEGLTGIDQIKLNDGLRNLKTYFKILGIILLIALIFCGIIFLFGVVFGSIGKSY